MKKDIVTAIVISYRSSNSLKDSLEDLENLRAMKSINLDVVVVDGGTIKKSIDKLKKQFPKVTFITKQENLGVGKSFNLGIKYGLGINADHFLLLNADIKFDIGYLKNAYNILKKNSIVGAVCGKVLFSTNPSKILFIGGRLDKKVKSTIHVGNEDVDKGQYKGIEESEILNCPILVRASVIKEVGLFREDYFMYYEDTDLYTRIRKAGYKLVVDRSVAAYTDYPEGDEESLNYLKRRYYNSRNLLYFISQNFSLKERLIAYAYVAKNSLPLIVNLLLNKKRKGDYFELLGKKDFLFGFKGIKNIE